MVLKEIKLEENSFLNKLKSKVFYLIKKVDKMSSCCAICYRVTEGNSIRDPNNHGTGEEIFFQLFQRYLDERVKVTNEVVLRPSSMFPLKRVKEMGMATCQGCQNTMSSFCNLYEQFKKAELQLDWKVEQIKSLMEGESTVIKYVVVSIGQLEVEDRYKKGATETIRVLDQSKKELIAKCSQKMKSSFPRVSIRRTTTSLKNSSLKNCKKRELKVFDVDVHIGTKWSRRTRDVGKECSGPSETNSNTVEEMDIRIQSSASDRDMGGKVVGNCSPKLSETLPQAVETVSIKINKPDTSEPERSEVTAGQGELKMNPYEKNSSIFFSSASCLKNESSQNTDKHFKIKKKAKYICGLPKCGRQFTTLNGFQIHSRDKHAIDLISPKPDKKSNVKKTGKQRKRFNIKSKLQIHPNESSPKFNVFLLSPVPILENELELEQVNSSLILKTTHPTPFNEALPTNDMIPIQEGEVNSSEQHQQDVDLIDLTNMTPENTRNPETGWYTCGLCVNVVFWEEKEVQRHYMFVHPDLRYKCPHPYCIVEYGDPLSVYKHYWRVHRNIRFECEKCNKIFGDGFELLKHKQEKMSCEKKICMIPEEAGRKIPVINSRW